MSWTFFSNYVHADNPLVGQFKARLEALTGNDANDVAELVRGLRHNSHFYTRSYARPADNVLRAARAHNQSYGLAEAVNMPYRDDNWLDACGAYERRSQGLFSADPYIELFTEYFAEALKVFIDMLTGPINIHIQDACEIFKQELRVSNMYAEPPPQTAAAGETAGETGGTTVRIDEDEDEDDN